MTFGNNYNQGNSPLGFDGLGGIVALGAIGCALWWGPSIFMAAPLATGVIGAFFIVVGIFYFTIRERFIENDGFIKFLLIASAFSFAATFFFSFYNGVLSLTVGNAVTASMLVLALWLGLWRILNIWSRTLAVAVVGALAGAPALEEVASKERWLIGLTVVDANCSPVAHASAVCQVILRGTDVVLQEKGPITLTSAGEMFFQFNGSPIGKQVRCDAQKEENGRGIAVAEAPWFGATFIKVQISKSDQQRRTCGGPS